MVECGMFEQNRLHGGELVAIGETNTGGGSVPLKHIAIQPVTPHYAGWLPYAAGRMHLCSAWPTQQHVAFTRLICMWAHLRNPLVIYNLLQVCLGVGCRLGASCDSGNMPVGSFHLQ